MNSLEKILKLQEVVGQAATLEQKQKIQDKAKTIFVELYSEREKITKIHDWLQNNWPDHERAAEGLTKYEGLCDGFYVKHGIYEHELDDTVVEWEPFHDPLGNIKGTAIDQYGQRQMTLKEWHDNL